MGQRPREEFAVLRQIAAPLPLAWYRSVWATAEREKFWPARGRRGKLADT